RRRRGRPSPRSSRSTARRRPPRSGAARRSRSRASCRARPRRGPTGTRASARRTRPSSTRPGGPREATVRRADLLRSALALGGAPALAPWPPSAEAADDIAAAEALLGKGEAAQAAAIFRRLAEAPGGGEDVRVQDGLASSLVALGDAAGARSALAFLAKRR